MTRAPRRNSAPKKRCVVCGMEKREYTKFSSSWVGKPVKVTLRLDHSHFRIGIISHRQREGAFEREVTADDVICKLCHNHHSSHAGIPWMTRSERVAEQAMTDARRIDLLLKFMDNDCGGQFPKWRVKYTLPGWNGPGEEAALIHARQWIRELIRRCRRPGSTTRLEAVAALGHAEAASVADLLSREKPANGNCDVEGDSRRVRILAKYVREKNGGELLRKPDVAALAGWEREDAGVAQAQVRQWWYNFSRRNGGERKKLVEESAPDEATKKALRDLAQCEKRNHGNHDVEGDSRRVRILAKYAREKNGGQLPRRNDVAELAGWKREDAGVAQARVGPWWYRFSTMNDGARKKLVEESAPDEATKKALRDLAQCEKRNHGNHDVEGDSRRVRILAKYAREKNGGQLPRRNDVAELAGWKREDAGVAQARVGPWWYRFSTMNDGARKKLVEESAPDEATKKVLRDLAQCPMRDDKRFKGRRN